MKSPIHPPIRRIHVLLLALLVFAAVTSLTTFCHAAPPIDQLTSAAPIVFGTLQTDSTHAAEEYAAGERTAMMEIFWDRYEPASGQFNTTYAVQQQAHLKMLKALGFEVTLALGTAAPPPWLAKEPNAQFIEQNGAVSRDLNYVFNRKMRGYFLRYLKRIDAGLGLKNFWAIRITSIGNGELLYPGGGSYWAFDVNAQNGPDRPTDLPPCPYPGWKPGPAGLNPEQIREWADWYVRCMALTADWQMRTIDTLGFAGWYQILTPGSGARPSVYYNAIQNHLPNGIIGVGAVWHKLYEFLPEKRRAVVYISSVADESGGDDTTQPDDVKVAISDPTADGWSAARWQVRIAREYGMPVGGENPGYSRGAKWIAHYLDAGPGGMMARSFAQAQAGHFQCFYWAHSGPLWDGTLPFSRYASAIAAANGANNPAPPWPLGGR